MDVMRLKQDQADLQIWEGESVVCWAPASSGRGARGAVEGVEREWKGWKGTGAAGPLPTRRRARSSGPPWRKHVSITEGHRAAGTAAQAGACVETLYFYILNKTPNNKPFQ